MKYWYQLLLLALGVWAMASCCTPDTVESAGLRVNNNECRYATYVGGSAYIWNRGTGQIKTKEMTKCDFSIKFPNKIAWAKAPKECVEAFCAHFAFSCDEDNNDSPDPPEGESWRNG